MEHNSTLGGPYMEIKIKVFQGSPPTPSFAKLVSRAAQQGSSNIASWGEGGWSIATFNLARFDFNLHLPSGCAILLAPRGEPTSLAPGDGSAETRDGIGNRL